MIDRRPGADGVRRAAPDHFHKPQGFFGLAHGLVIPRKVSASSRRWPKAGSGQYAVLARPSSPKASACASDQFGIPWMVNCPIGE